MTNPSLVDLAVVALNAAADLHPDLVSQAELRSAADGLSRSVTTSRAELHSAARVARKAGKEVPLQEAIWASVDAPSPATEVRLDDMTKAAQACRDAWNACAHAYSDLP